MQQRHELDKRRKRSQRRKDEGKDNREEDSQSVSHGFKRNLQFIISIFIDQISKDFTNENDETFNSFFNLSIPFAFFFAIDRNPVIMGKRRSLKIKEQEKRPMEGKNDARTCIERENNDDEGGCLYGASNASRDSKRYITYVLSLERDFIARSTSPPPTSIHHHRSTFILQNIHLQANSTHIKFMCLDFSLISIRSVDLARFSIENRRKMISSIFFSNTTTFDFLGMFLIFFPMMRES